MKLIERAQEPVDAAPLIFFRAAFGILLSFELLRYLLMGWVTDYWVTPTLFFNYLGLAWVTPWPGVGMYLEVGALAVLSAMIAVGYRYRLACGLFLLGFTHLFLSAQSVYLNHFYAVCLFALVLLVVPAHVDASFDGRREPDLRSSTVPAWSLWLARFPMAVIYFYGGIAKLNPDWLRGQPLTLWLQETQGLPEFMHGSIGLYLSWFGAGFDLMIVPLLLWKRTRALAFAAVLLFHLTNAWMFNIGVFPWLSIAATTLFLDPKHPLFEANLQRWRLDAPERRLESPRWLGVLIGVFVALQLLVPLRHHLYPNEVSWTEDGHMFAWHMKLRDKVGKGHFRVRFTETGEELRVDPMDHLTSRQAFKMMIRPDMILQYAHFLARQYGDRGEVEVYAHVRVSLNSRDRTEFTDSAVNLAKIDRTFGPTTWILPFSDTPLVPPPKSLFSK